MPRWPAPAAQIAGEHATGRVPMARRGNPTGAVRSAMTGAAFDCTDDVAVLDGRRLVAIAREPATGDIRPWSSPASMRTRTSADVLLHTGRIIIESLQAGVLNIRRLDVPAP